MGGWLSGSCSDDEPGLFVVHEKRPEGWTGDEVERSESGRVIWIDGGSGPGHEVWVADDRDDRDD